MRFEPASSYFLVALALLPLVWWRWKRWRTHGSLRFSSIEPLRMGPRGLAVRLRWVVPLLRCLVLALLVICLARPEKGIEQTRIYAEGIAIQMVVDLSSSMENQDYAVAGRRTTRLEAVKRVFREFVEGAGGTSKGREDDLIGLIGFARYPDSLAPLTLDHESVLTILDQAETALGPTVQAQIRELRQSYTRAAAAGDQRRMQQLMAEGKRLEEENQTAIGDALGLAVERLRDLDRRRTSAVEAGRTGGQRIKSKVVILLSDGENNAGDLTPKEAMELAKACGIKVYAIGIGSQVRGGAIVDEEQMRQGADATGGRYFRADDTRALREVYAQIDKLEKTETQERRFLQYKALAIHPVELGPVRLPPLLAIVLMLLGAEVVLSNTRLRRIP